MFGYIYKTTNLINQKTYIGKKKGSFDKNYFGSGIILKQAIEKYGAENFSVELVCECNSLDDLNNSEITMIEEFKPSYNIAKGGDGGDTLYYHNATIKNQIVEKRANTLKNTYNTMDIEKRKSWSKSISEAKKGKSNGREGYKHKSESIEKIKKSNKEAAKKRNTEWYDNHKKAMGLRKGKSNVASKTPVVIENVRYDGVGDAATALGVSRRTIRNWIIKGKAHYG